MPDHNAIYREQNKAYEALISREDYQGNLLRVLSQIAPFQDAVVIDTGAGTGRLVRLLCPLARKVHAFDLSPHMLETALETLRQTACQNWTAAAGDHRALPVQDHFADILVSGWSLSMLFVNHPHDWQRQVQRGLEEIRRVVKPGGTAVLIETLGTGYEQPIRYPFLEPYFAFLEEEGFQVAHVRTDYQFESLEEARERSAFFFGEELARQVVEKNWVVLPECTGVWWKNL